MIYMDTELIKNELRSSGIKNTRAKSILLHILKNSNAPIDVSTLHMQCKQDTPVNLVTIYRSLQQFHDKDLVQEFHGQNGVVQYEYIHKGAKAHPHFQCEQCKKVICLGELSFNDALYFSNMAKQHTINSINITLNGTCKACQLSQ